MNQYSRRDFLTHSAVGALALASHGMLSNAVFAAEPAEMAIAKWNGAKDLNPEQLKEAAVKLTEKAIEGIGGLKRFVSKGSVIWIKPNIGWDRTPELAANTNPDVVATLIRLCFDAGAKTVKVGDNPCSIPAKAYAASGIEAAAKQAGAEVVFLDLDRFKDTQIKGEKLKNIPVFPPILECDLVINVPIIKHHKNSDLTMCMKNYMGVVDKKLRSKFHQDFATYLTDITRFMKPQISLLEGIRVLKDHGPQGGNLADVEMKLTLAAGTDVVALDAWGAELMGRSPTSLGFIKKGAETGLGRIDYKSIAKEIAVS
jgi:uncharacterized protein (DUF362 family)